ncbi:helix-turn-helix domain-containing protein [Arabiibacter massiliensis]|uniref:helix-turn-helix domain-containing protein n=1 Tax=Arabiibacter massiliensis TaxID=1870985 RepID=UPI0009BB18DF|nr:helix-turn-helix domain-containing protein [Arabiibacter massiliensis]
MGADITPAEIKRIRSKYGLSQQAFARLLGIGEASMVRYENGQPPSKANANLIRAADHTAFMHECLERDGDSIPPAQRERVEKVVYAMVTFDDEGEIMDINEMYMLTLEQEILNEKAAEILSEVSRLYLEAKEDGDEASMMVYDDVMSMIAERKGQIIREVDGSAKKLAEIRGAIDGLAHFARLHAAKAA